MRSRQPFVVVQSVGERFGGLDGLHGYGGKNGGRVVGRREMRNHRFRF